ncbi:MAG TPA: coniferyl aldehyde dehydrogenase [Steroidobacter sp.]|nr:coniferyl aldehyde dehydrogenase [Steroidobacter sp.]
MSYTMGRVEEIYAAHEGRGQTTLAAQLGALYREQRSAFERDSAPDARVRRERLRLLERVLLDNADAITNAISADFGHRPATETQLIEVFQSLESLRYARRHVGRWMRPERRHVAIWYRPGQAHVRYQPLGAVGIVVPWNYPLYLSVGPLASALAAGNRAMLKLSEYTPAFGALFADLIAKTFPRDLVHVVLGDVETARAFVDLPFDHLLYTGSTAIGREVMAAAARNLTPVTLELGGKSPAIIAPGFDPARAAQRIVFGKLVNAGQTCIAPDYVLAQASSIETLLAHMRRTARDLYRDAASLDYASIAHDRQYARLTSMLDDARAQGARIEPLLDAGNSSLPRRMPPVAVLNATDAMRVMREEIFGPILPIVPYQSLDEAVRYVNERERPLALYVFDDDTARRERLLASTASGGVVINDTLLHVSQDDLPFGGVGPSGMGRYHGPEGFRTFSQVRSVFTQRRLNTLPLLYPPYDRPLGRRILKFMLRG